MSCVKTKIYCVVENLYLNETHLNKHRDRVILEDEFPDVAIWLYLG